MALPVDIDAPAAALARLDDEWTKTSVSFDELYADIPDGTYNTVIEEARLTENRLDRTPNGRLETANSGTAGRKPRGDEEPGGYREYAWVSQGRAGEMRAAGIASSELPARLRELVNHPIDVQKSTKDGRVNFYFRWDSNRSDKSFVSDDLPFKDPPQCCDLSR